MAAFFYSLMNMVVVLEPVHFGPINCSEYNALALALTQEKYDFKLGESFEWINGEFIIVSYCKPSIIELPVEVKIPIMARDRLIGYNSVSIDPEPEAMIVTCPFEPSRVLDGCDVIQKRVPECDNLVLEREVSVNVAVDPGQILIVILPPLVNIFPLQGCYIEQETASVDLVAKGANIFDKSPFFDSACSSDEFSYYKAQAEKNFVSFIATFRWTGYIERWYERVNLPRAIQFENKCATLFGEWDERLGLFPQSALIKYNRNSLRNYILGYGMPHPGLLNQVIVMLGEKFRCSYSYDISLERWRFYPRYMDWRPSLKLFVEKKKVLRSVFSVFDDFEFTYGEDRVCWCESDLEKCYDEVPYRHDVYMDYVDYLGAQESFYFRAPVWSEREFRDMSRIADECFDTLETITIGEW
jgi:hypothetical protein